MHPYTITFIGPQGSGKGTQASRVLSYLKEYDTRPVVDLETGHGFRIMAESNSFTGQRVREALAKGEMVPNFITSSVVVGEVIERLTADAHLVIDGFPRTVDQARVLRQMVEFYPRKNVIAIYLSVPDEVVIERMKSRGRADDTDELIAERLRLYKEQTMPLIELYRNDPNINLVEIDGTKPVDEVFEDIKAALPLS